MHESAEKTKTSDKGRAPDRIRNWSGRVRRFAERRMPTWLHFFKEARHRRWALIAVTSLIAAFTIGPKSSRVYTLAVGETAQETIFSPITFKVVDEAATNKNRDDVLKSLRPVYDFDDEMVHDVQARIIAAFSFMRDYLAAEAEQGSRKEGADGEAPVSPEKKNASTKSFRALDDQTLRTRFENLLGTTVSPSTFALLKNAGFNARVERDLRSLVVPVLLKGVVLSRDLVLRDGKQGILVQIKSKDKLEPLKDLSTLFDLKEAINFINVEDWDPARDTALARAVRRIATSMINVNVTYNRDRSAAVKKEALASVKPVYFQIAKGEPIIKDGEPVNEGHLRKLAGLNKANPAYSRYAIFVGLAVILLLLLHLCCLFSERYLDRSGHANEDLVLICLLLLGTLFLVKFISSLSPLLTSAGPAMNTRSIFYAAPVATGAMLASLMVDARIAFMFAALTAATSTLAVEGDVYLFVYYFISGIVGLHGMARIVDRTSVLRAGLLVGLVNMAAILALKMAVGQVTNIQDSYEMGLGFLGGVFSGLLVSGLAPLLERLGYVTNIKLLEMANLNHPLLKQMALEAPGTYHHSIMVGNLAETTAEVIGANPLLARVGALFHDIGKTGKNTKPFYFIENQERGANPHDKLEPSMSSLILVAHVKNGVEKAQKYGLGTAITDIIQQHHGTNLIRFFYNKALEKAEKNGQVVSEEKFHYPGPRPQSKEAALVMLADVTEAACRTLTDPTPARIQKRVQTLVMQLFSEGQLDQSTLTLKDLHAITKSFVRTLQGVLHSRIDYPTETRSQERTNGDSHRHPPEKDRHRPGRAAEENGASIRRLGL